MSLNKSVNVNVQGNENTQVDVNVIVGKSYEYNDLLDKLKTQQKLFDRTPEDEVQERLEISGKINELKNQIEQFKQDVLKLAEAFQNLEINTERLKRAKEHFEKGEIGEARAVLEMELEQMQTEQKHLLREREHYETETLPKLQNNSEEFYLLALSIQADYPNPNRFADTCRHFQSSIESYPTKSNVFDYAKFLHDHNQFAEAEGNYKLYLDHFKNERTEDENAATLNNLAILHKDQNRYEEAATEFQEALRIYRQLAEIKPQKYLPDVATILNNLANLHKIQNNYEEAATEYEEALRIKRRLAETNPQTHLPAIATTLNNLASLHLDQNKYQEAATEYEEALRIRRRLAETNPQTYLPAMAMTLNNLAILHQVQNIYEEAATEFQEALRIYRLLAETNLQKYLPDVAMTLNNLAVLHQAQNIYEEAATEFEEALQICRQLAQKNLQAYLPAMATTLNNLANLHSDQNNYEKAATEYEEALRIRIKLAESNPQVYQIKVAQTNYNLAIFYQDNLPNRKKSIECAITTSIIFLEIADIVISTQKYLESTMNILRKWNLTAEEIQQLVDEKLKETE